MKTQNGFTLIEIVVVISIIAVLLTLAVLPLMQYHQKYTVESYAKNIFTILTRARNDAANINTASTVTIGTHTVRVVQDRDQDGNTTGSGESMEYSFPQYTLNTLSGSTIVFDRRGLADGQQAIYITSYSQKVTPNRDCVGVEVARISLGKWTGGACEPQ